MAGLMNTVTRLAGGAARRRGTAGAGGGMSRRGAGAGMGGPATRGGTGGGMAGGLLSKFMKRR